MFKSIFLLSKFVSSKVLIYRCELEIFSGNPKIFWDQWSDTFSTPDLLSISEQIESHFLVVVSMATQNVEVPHGFVSAGRNYIYL